MEGKFIYFRFLIPHFKLWSTIFVVDFVLIVIFSEIKKNVNSKLTTC